MPIDFSRLRFPTAEEQEQARRFQVVKNYLRNIYDYLSWHYTGKGFTLSEKLLQTQRSLPNFQRIQRRPTNANELKRRLWLGWSAEVQLRAGDKENPAMLPYTNAWAPVHAYYAVYMSMHALFVAMGLDSPRENHSGSLNTVSEQIVGRGLLPLPWSVACGGCPQVRERVLLSLPDGADPDVHFELLSNPDLDTFWPRYAKMLEKTREDRLDRAFDGWRRNNRRRNMWADEKRSVARKVPPTTVFEYFLKLRLRSNYQDARSYVMSAVSNEWQREFHASLVRTTAMTCLLLESLMVQHVGGSVLDEACGEFLGSDPVGGLNAFVEIRRDQLLN